VATDWTALAQTGIGAAAAIGGGIVGAWMQARSQRSTEQQRQRERAAELVAEVLDLLIDTAPDQLAIDRQEGTATPALTALKRRHEAARRKLYTLSVWHPSKRVRDLATDASNAMWEALDVSVRYLVHYFKEPGEGVRSEDAEQAWQAANAVVSDLMAAVRRG
jgi:hypothetical protein